MSKVTPSQAWENFRRWVAEQGGVVLEPDWRGSHAPYLCRCANDHECRPWASGIQRGGNICRTCAYDASPANAQRAATLRDAFYKQVAEQGGVVLEPKYLGARAPHLCRCVNGHECRPWPSNVQRGGNICRACAGRDSVMAWENFRRQVTELGGKVLEPEWRGSFNPHLCRCANGHQCRPSPSSVQQGRGICRACLGLDPATARENFYRRVAELGGVVLEQRWLSSGVAHLCRCARGHECRPQPNSIQQGTGICWTCAGWDQDVLYVVRNPVTCCVKFGITRRDGRARLGGHRKNGYAEVLRLETGLPEGVAALTEQKIKLALAMAGAVPVRGTEYFGDEHLALIDNEIDNWVPLAAAQEPALSVTI